MSAAEFSEAVRNLEFFTAIRESLLVYPIILSTHLSSIAVFGGLILMTDLRLLGLAMKNVPVAEMIRRTRPLKHLGFVIMVSCGIMLAGSKLEGYYNNPYFQLKLTLLALVCVHALVFRRSVYGNPERLDAMTKLPRAAKLAGCTSLILWVGILSAGRMIAYFEPAKPAPATHSASLQAR